MLILALDTATRGCSVALWRDGTFLARRARQMARGQSEVLVPMIQEVLTEAGLGAMELDLIAVTHGPGAFTGLRIGLATARALALAAGLPCLGVHTTEVVARGVPQQHPKSALLIALDTKRDDFYIQLFTPDRQPLGPPQALPSNGIVELARKNITEFPLWVAGDAADAVLKILTNAGLTAQIAQGPGLPDAGHLAEIAAGRWQPGQVLAPPEPLYLRPPDAKLPRHGGRLRP